jgi:predicted small secreted protein
MKGAGMKRIVALLMALGVLAGCNTMEGLGKDIKEGGQKLEKAANK